MVHGHLTEKWKNIRLKQAASCNLSIKNIFSTVSLPAQLNRTLDYINHFVFTCLLVHQCTTVALSLWLICLTNLLLRCLCHCLNLYLLICTSCFLSVLGRRFAGALGGEGAVHDQKDQAAAGPDWWKEHADGGDQRHEGHAGCQREEG